MSGEASGTSIIVPLRTILSAARARKKRDPLKCHIRANDKARAESERNFDGSDQKAKTNAGRRSNHLTDSVESVKRYKTLRGAEVIPYAWLGAVVRKSSALEENDARLGGLFD